MSVKEAAYKRTGIEEKVFPTKLYSPFWMIDSPWKFIREEINSIINTESEGENERKEMNEKAFHALGCKNIGEMLGF
jgi:hypothetical protein